jgi:hypothetical protein
MSSRLQLPTECPWGSNHLKYAQPSIEGTGKEVVGGRGMLDANLEPRNSPRHGGPRHRGTSQWMSQLFPFMHPLYFRGQGTGDREISKASSSRL